MIEKEIVEKWYELYKQGLSQEEVGGIVGLSRPSIHCYFKKFGFPIRTNYSERARKKLGKVMKGISPEKHPRWRGGEKIIDGYIYVMKPDHPRAIGKYVCKHILIIEKALGKFFVEPHCSHHINKRRIDNSNNNLVACEDKNYHNLLHLRRKALDACGHVDWRRCVFCKEWDDPINVFILNNTARHKKCQREYDKNRGH